MATVRLTITGGHVPGGRVEATADSIFEAEQLATVLNRAGCEIKTELVKTDYEAFDWEVMR